MPYYSKKMVVDTNEATWTPGTNFRSVIIQNYGSEDILVDFDKTVDSGSSFLIPAGMNLNDSSAEQVKTFHFKAVSGSSTIYIILVTNP